MVISRIGQEFKFQTASHAVNAEEYVQAYHGKYIVLHDDHELKVSIGLARMPVIKADICR